MGALDREGFTPTSIRDLSDRSWLVQAKAPEALQRRSSIAPELLFVVSKGELFARDIQRAEQEPYRAGLRLDYDLLIAVNAQEDLQERLERSPGRGQRVAWPWNGESFRPLTERLNRALPRFDLFDEMDPVRGRAVIGRREEITELTRRIERGGGLAVTGLRKVGKTTLVRAVTDRLDYREVHRQLASYWTSDTCAGAVVMVTDRAIRAEDYAERCLSGLSADSLDVSELSGWWRVCSQRDDGARIVGDHFLLRLPVRQ